jgi:hypothetical protein
MTPEQFYLHFGKGNEPRQTVKVAHRVSQEPRKGRTTSGYGRALPTPYEVKWQGRWYRVKACQISNAGTMYIGKPGDWLAIVSC